MAKLLIGLKVSYRTVRLPVSLPASPPWCEDDPEDCCPCCPNALPEVLYAEVTLGADCECVPLCLALTYDAEYDAWFSEDLSQWCETTASFIRLKCVEGVWHVDIVGGDLTSVLESAALDSSVCDPFAVTATFAGITVPCAGGFTVEITPNDCGAVEPPAETECCENPVPARLFATFSGTDDCACLSGTIQIDYNPATEKWEGSGTLCGLAVAVKFYCSTDPQWTLDVITVHGQDGHSAVPASCDPFEWSSTLVLLNAHVCDIGGLVTVTETAP